MGYKGPDLRMYGLADDAAAAYAKAKAGKGDNMAEWAATILREQFRNSQRCPSNKGWMEILGNSVA